MAYDFLNKTTYTDQLQQQDALLQDLFDQEQEQAPSDYEDIEPELIQIIDEASEPAADDEADVNFDEQEQKENDKYDYDDDDTNTDMEFLDFLFSEKKVPTSGGGSIASANNFVDGAADLGWLKKKTNNVKVAGLNQKISKYLTGLPEDLREGLVATSGNDDSHAKGSKHYDNNAIDLRFNQKAFDYINNDPVAKELGISTLNPNHGTAKHIHLETKQFGGKVKPKYNFGGKTLYADTEEVLRRGLNDSGYNDAILKLSGINTIRGLDNNQPVAVTDGSKYQVLNGPKDTAKFNGTVYEQRLK